MQHMPSSRGRVIERLPLLFKSRTGVAVAAALSHGRRSWHICIQEQFAAQTGRKGVAAAAVLSFGRCCYVARSRMLYYTAAAALSHGRSCRACIHTFRSSLLLRRQKRRRGRSCWAYMRSRAEQKFSAARVEKA